MNVSFSKFLNKIRLKDHKAVLTAVLPDRYSPLQASGNGIQSIYLTELSQDQMKRGVAWSRNRLPQLDRQAFGGPLRYIFCVFP